MDRCQGGKFRARRGKLAGSAQMDYADRKSCKYGYGKGGGRQALRMGTRNTAVTPHIAIDLGRILRRDQIVGHGDSWQKNQNDDRKYNELRTPIFRIAWLRTQPRA